MRESIGGDFFQGGGGGGLALIVSLCDGGVEMNFSLMRRGYDLVLGHISPISPPPHPVPQVIIAQSLKAGPIVTRSCTFSRTFFA